MKPECIFDDIISDYSRKTVTLEPFPYTNFYCASIHNCQHAKAMFNIVSAMQSVGVKISPDHALFIFLKFVNTIAPTIEFDFTSMNVITNMEGGK